MPEQAQILIIDDDPMICMLVSSALQGSGLKTMTAASGEEGIRLFQKHRADAILLDLMMPGGIDGFVASAKIRQLQDGKDIPILIMTGMDDMKSINRAYETGVTDFIIKPINFALLGYRVSYMLKSSEMTKKIVESERRLHRMAFVDELTELPNRQFFKENLQIMLALAHRQKRKLGVLFVDVDGFKRINDSLGHHLGDKVIQEISKRLRRIFRASDVVTRAEARENEEVSLARLGGDEFTIMLSKIERNEDALIVAERIQHSFRTPLLLDGQELFITSSIGISVFPDDGDTADEILRNADLAMYHAKLSGGNTCRYFRAHMTDSAKRRLSLENHLHKAIANNELELHYQPQLNLMSEGFCGVEALLRWRNRELGFVSPAEFIPLAEDSGLIVNIGEWVLREACRQTKKWHDQGFFIRLAVNVSPKQLRHKDFSALVAKVVAETGIEPHRLELEVTESALIFEEEVILDVLNALKTIGVQLAIDDFGTGYSSLNRLKKFPIDRLKIDQSFVRDLETDTANLAIVTAIIAMAESMNMSVIAEGIETKEQLTIIKSKRCAEGQGYLLSKPLPFPQIEYFLKEKLSDATSGTLT